MTSDDRNSRKAYFDELYGRDSDPWRYETGDYEIEKRRNTLSFLKPRYVSACEVGCSIGVLTQDLATRCDRLLGLDISPTAIALARDRLRTSPHVRVEVRHLPHDDLGGCVDLLVLSEMLYFLEASEITGLAEMAAQSVEPGGDVLIVSFDGETQTRWNGRQTTDMFLAASASDFERIRFEQCQHYHVCLLRRRHDLA